ncbi:MAG: Cof-type HAD-IIB family hydrolase [Oscillospiraceae bacterium]|nr:Cof-type HAD-IIB family hydrolase [Oscillospiraceae bacterium]
MSYKLLVLDLDGTLTNSQKVITPATRAALDKAMEKGVKVVLASGRPTYGIVPLARELDLAHKGGYILSFNGGRITDCQSGEVIYERVLSAEKAGELYDLSQKYKVNIMTYEDENIITEKPDDQYVELESRINKMNIKKVESFRAHVTFPVNKCLMVEDGDYLGEVEKKVKAAVGDELSVCRSEAFFLEIMPKNIDKAYSLGKLLEHLGMTKDEMICCGDGFNDKSMIEYAGLGVAMMNGKPEVKAAADYIAPSNDEDGIAHVVEKFLL